MEGTCFRTMLATLVGLVMVGSVSSASLFDGYRSTENICKNGGIMVLGSFCICPSNYGGQYCEEEENQCGSVLHDETVEIDCNLCLCRNGRLYCVPHGEPDCYKEVREEVVKVITMAPEPTTEEVEYESSYMDEWWEISAAPPLSSVAVPWLACLLCLVLYR